MQTTDISESTLEAAGLAHPLPWKARARPVGSKQRPQFPWEVFDAKGATVALCASSMAASLLTVISRAT